MHSEAEASPADTPSGLGTVPAKVVTAHGIMVGAGRHLEMIQLQPPATGWGDTHHANPPSLALNIPRMVTPQTPQLLLHWPGYSALLIFTFMMSAI